MTNSFKQTIYFFVILVIANVLSGVYNVTQHFRGNLNDVKDATPILIWCSLLFWISCQWKPKTKLRYYFLPIFRICFWTIVVVDGILNNTRMISEDCLFANNEMFFWWTTIRIISTPCRNLNGFIELFVIDIFAIGIGQFFMIKAAIAFDKSISNKV